MRKVTRKQREQRIAGKSLGLQQAVAENGRKMHNDEELTKVAGRSISGLLKSKASAIGSNQKQKQMKAETAEAGICSTCRYLRL